MLFFSCCLSFHGFWYVDIFYFHSLYVLFVFFDSVLLVFLFLISSFFFVTVVCFVYCHYLFIGFILIYVMLLFQ